MPPAAEHADQRRLQARTSPEGAAGAGGSELGLSGGDPQSQVRRAHYKQVHNEAKTDISHILFSHKVIKSDTISLVLRLNVFIPNPTIISSFRLLKISSDLTEEPDTFFSIFCPFEAIFASLH